MAGKIVVPYAFVFYIPDFVHIYCWLESQDKRLDGLMHGRIVCTNRDQSHVSYVYPASKNLFLFSPRFFIDEYCLTLILWGRFNVREIKSVKSMDLTNLLEEFLIYEEGRKRVVKKKINIDKLLEAISIPAVHDRSTHWLIAQGLMELLLEERGFKHRSLVKFKKILTGLLVPSHC